jgi:hypothetical protein
MTLQVNKNWLCPSFCIITSAPLTAVLGRDTPNDLGTFNVACPGAWCLIEEGFDYHVHKDLKRQVGLHCIQSCASASLPEERRSQSDLIKPRFQTCSKKQFIG